jgi:hypothetical protein
VTADKSFANEEMKRRLSSLQAAADKSLGEKKLELGKRSLDIRKRGLDIEAAKFRSGMALGEERRDFLGKEHDIGTLISLANIPIAGYLGYGQMKRDIARAKKLEDLVERWWRWPGFSGTELSGFTPT